MTMVKANRSRTRRILVEATDAEYALAKQKAKAAGVCMRELIARAVAAYDDDRLSAIESRVAAIESRFVRPP